MNDKSFMMQDESLNYLHPFFDLKIRAQYILAVLVTFIHNGSFFAYSCTPYNIFFSQFLRSLLPAGSVSLFFIISGYMMFRDVEGDLTRCYIRKMKHRVKSLFVPYIIWNTVGLLFTLFRTEVLSFFMDINSSFEIGIPNIIKAIFFHTEMPVLWFMKYLIIFSLLFPVMYIMAVRKNVGIAVLLLWMILPSMIQFPQYLMESFVSYFLGVMLSVHWRQWFALIIFHQKKLLYGFGVAIIWAYLYINLNVYKMPNWINIVVINFYALLMWQFFKSVLIGKPFSWEKNSAMLYFLHAYFLAIITKLVIIVMPADAYVALPVFLMTSIMLCVSVELFCRIVQKFTPKIYSLISGGR